MSLSDDAVSVASSPEPSFAVVVSSSKRLMSQYLESGFLVSSLHLTLTLLMAKNACKFLFRTFTSLFRQTYS